MHERLLVRLLKEICAEKAIELEVLSHGWVFRMVKHGNIRHVYGNNFDIDTAATQKIVSDKAAVSQLFTHLKVPHVEHRMFLNPFFADYVSLQGNWEKMRSFAESYDNKVVVKAAQGSSGNEVFLASNPRDLELHVNTLFRNERAICFSPYVPYENEYRLVMLNGQVQLCYQKVRPRVTGDGVSSLAQLIARESQDQPLLVKQQLLAKNAGVLDKVLDKGEDHLLHWQHNLSKGSRPQPVMDLALVERLTHLAQEVVAALTMRFVSVDIIEHDGELLVLEVNSGVMMDNYVRLLPDGYAQAKEVYDSVMTVMFESVDSTSII